MTKYEKQAKEYMDPYRKEALGDKLKLYQQKAQDTRKVYDTQIFETGRAYEDSYRENAVQKAINERQVAESMANMGLRDSGLNRTQQTAVNLSYANAKAGIDKTKRQAIDNIELQKASDLSTIRQNWLADKASINQAYDGYEADYAASLDKAAKSVSSGGDNKPKGFITKDGNTFNIGMEGTVGSNNIRVIPGTKDNSDGYWYFDDTTGKKSFFALGVNPFTNTTHKDALDKNGNYDPSRVWEANGYQPKYKGNIELKLTTYKDSGKTAVYEMYGIDQKVWSDGKGNFYIWDKYVNDYKKIPPEHCTNYEA